MKRKKPMARGKGLERRTPLERGEARLTRKKPIKRESAKMKRRRDEWGSQLDSYFQGSFGRDGDEGREAPCQSCGCWMVREHAHPHHKVRRGEGGSDEPENLVALCAVCHILFIHDGQIGAQSEASRERCRVVRESPANLLNGQKIGWAGPLLDELKKLHQRWG